jgi:hypothetical protein
MEGTGDRRHEASQDAVHGRIDKSRGRCHNTLSTRADDGSVGENERQQAHGSVNLVFRPPKKVRKNVEK